MGLLWMCPKCLEDQVGSLWDHYDPATGEAVCTACRPTLEDEPIPCDTCGGSGLMWYGHGGEERDGPCTDCGGRGQ